MPDWMQVQDEFIVVLIAIVALVAALILLVGPLVRANISAWFEREAKRLENALPENIASAIRMAALLAARAAEQMQLAGYVESEGKAKLKRAEELAEAWLAAQGYRGIELDAIRLAIENVIWSGEHRKPATVEAIDGSVKSADGARPAPTGSGVVLPEPLETAEIDKLR